MKVYSLVDKGALVQKALSRGVQSLEQFAIENNIGYSTIQRWLKDKREGKPLGVVPTTQPSGDELNFLSISHILATANLDKQAIGDYCRRQGIFSFQLEQWRDKLMSDCSDKNDQQDKNQEQDCDELKKLREENKSLKRDLRQKDKA